MATSKIISIKNSPGACIDYVKDKNKTIVCDKNLSALAALKYITNDVKTTHGQNILVDGVGCSAAKADLEFQIREMEYHSQTKEVMKDGKVATQAFQLIQSFSEEDCKKKTPEELHQIGIEFAKRVTGEQFQCVVATHINTDHWHNHIVICAYAKDGPYKFISNKDKYREIRKINDELCKENELSIIIPKNMNKIANYYEWEQIHNGTSWKEQIREDIKSTMEISKDWAEFERILKQSGYEIKFNKSSITYKPPGALHGVRDIRLGQSYTAEYLNNYWDKNREKERKQEKAEDKKKEYVNTYVSKYSDSGRKRYFIEWLLLKVIAQLKKVLLEKKNSEERIEISKKIQSLLDTQKYIQEHNIKTIEDVNKSLNEIGIDINNLKIELEAVNTHSFNIEEVLKKYEKYKEYQELLEGSGVKINKLQPREYTEEEKRIVKAELDPMTKNQKKELYKLLEDHQDIKIKYKFIEITREDAQEVIDYIKGKTPHKNSLIIETEEFNKNRKNINSIKTLEKMPITAAQKIAINNYITKNKIELKKEITNKREATEFLDYVEGKSTIIPSTIKTEQDKYIETYSVENQEIIKEYLKLQDEVCKLELNKEKRVREIEEKMEELNNRKFEIQRKITENGKRYRDLKQLEKKARQIEEKEKEKEQEQQEKNKLQNKEYNIKYK